MANIDLIVSVPEYIYKLCQNHGDPVYRYIGNGIRLQGLSDDVKKVMGEEYRVACTLCSKEDKDENIN